MRGYKGGHRAIMRALVRLWRVRHAGDPLNAYREMGLLIDAMEVGAPDPNWFGTGTGLTTFRNPTLRRY